MDTTAQNQTSVVMPAASVAATQEPTASRESLEDQNIFVLLGVADGTDEEKESFLDELQQVIWEDFIENDVKVLLTSDELAQLNTLLQQQYSSELEKQEKVVLFLEKLVPDLEDIMLEKALELKADLFRERLQSLQSYYGGNSGSLAAIEQARELMREDKWAAAAGMVNSL
ncbi:hypothetical protein KBC79_01050 [Candidatus Woesebacteria bacterium]|nr:hypothetical protein [Candidatus Woesebacteria bacterium]